MRRPVPASSSRSLRTSLIDQVAVINQAAVFILFRARSFARQREGPWDAANSQRCAISNCLLMTVNALNFRKDYFTKQNRLKVTLWGCHAPPLGFLVLAAFWVGVRGGGGGGSGYRERGSSGICSCFLCGRGPTACMTVTCA